MGVSVEVVCKPKKPVAERWAVEWAKEGKRVDWQSLMPPKGFQVLPPRRWVVERTFFLLGPEQETEQGLRGCAGELGGVIVYAAMRRLMARRLARA